MLSIIIPLAPGETEWRGLVDQLADVVPAGTEILLVPAGDMPANLASASPDKPGHDGGETPLSTRQAFVSAMCDPGSGKPDHAVGGPPTLRIIPSPAGRAVQMNRGAAAATGDWLWFLHADSRLTPACIPALTRFLARSEPSLGWFDLAFLPDGPRLTRLNAVGANLRSRWLGIPFGDQGFVIPARHFARLGGYDEHAPRGEDHLFVWTARRHGLPLRRIPAALATSARKYRRQGWVLTTLRHIGLTARQAWAATHPKAAR